MPFQILSLHRGIPATPAVRVLKCRELWGTSLHQPCHTPRTQGIAMCVKCPGSKCYTKLFCFIHPGLICSCGRGHRGQSLANNDWSKTPGAYFGRQAFNKKRLEEAQCRGDQMKHNRLWWNLSRWDDLMVSFDLKLYKAVKYLSAVSYWDKCLPSAFHLMQWK